MTEQELARWKQWIDDLSREDMARLQRFAPAGHPVFRSDLPLYEYFQARFKRLGGMSPEISKRIGAEAETDG